MAEFRLLLKILSLVTLVSACASPQTSHRRTTLPDFDEKNTARGEAFAAEGFMVKRSFRQQDKSPDYPFFYKKCAVQSRGAHVTRIDYACSAIGH